MDHNQAQKRYWDSVAADNRVPEDARLPFPAIRERDLFFKFAGFKKGDEILEIGCGTGRYTLNLLRMGCRVQATIVIPYPGSALFDECGQNGWLNTGDWDRYDMKEPVMKTSISDKELMGLVRQIYKTGLSPEFLFNRLKSVRDAGDVKYFGRAGRKLVGHILDFNPLRGGYPTKR